MEKLKTVSTASMAALGHSSPSPVHEPNFSAMATARVMTVTSARNAASRVIEREAQPSGKPCLQSEEHPPCTLITTSGLAGRRVLPIEGGGRRADRGRQLVRERPRHTAGLNHAEILALGIRLRESGVDTERRERVGEPIRDRTGRGHGGVRATRPLAADLAVADA